MMYLQRFEFNPFQENTYVLYDDRKEAIIVDPGCYDKDERDELESFIAANQLKVSKLINTHGHIDHVLGNSFVKTRFKVKLFLHRLDEPVLKAVKAYAPNYGFTQYEEADIDEYLEEGKPVVFGNQSLEVLFVPGHSPGHIALYHRDQKILIGGDVLFYNSIGRTDLPGGDFDTLLESIHSKIFTLPPEVKVYPGHGPETTVGYERKTNPFCAVEQ
jgi:glyoxylase-like metal-dependent hydrolase (beta-lactamase superfamily II)